MIVSQLGCLSVSSTADAEVGDEESAVMGRRLLMAFARQQDDAA
ncbi:hypothetical protein [Streptomyces sp. NPDC048568]